MNARLLELAERRAVLVSRAAAQREQLAAAWHYSESPVRKVEQAVALIKYVPVVATGLAALLVRAPMRKLVTLPQLAWSGWQLYRRFRPLRR